MSQLAQALGILGYANAKELHHRSNFVHAILMFSTLTKNTELEAECEAELETIRGEIAQSQAPIAVTVNFGDEQRNSGRLQPGRVQINVGRNQRNSGGDYIEN